jgi:hypothetical protein
MNNTFVDNQTIFNRLDDKRNWISEWAKINKSIPENFAKKLKSDDNEKIKKKSKIEKKWISIKFDLRVTKYVFI